MVEVGGPFLASNRLARAIASSVWPSNNNVESWLFVGRDPSTWGLCDAISDGQCFMNGRLPVCFISSCNNNTNANKVDGGKKLRPRESLIEAPCPSHHLPRVPRARRNKRMVPARESEESESVAMMKRHLTGQDAIVGPPFRR